jgi:AhpD family alkylhydroperoxidase
MVSSYQNLNDEVRTLMEECCKLSPNVMNTFMDLHKTSTKDGALSKKFKELIALAIGITVRCDGCIAFHVNDALKAGATNEEIIETIGVAIMMGGGPSVVYGSQAIKAMKELDGNINCKDI